MSSKLDLLSWILLTLLGVITLLGSLASINVAYFQDDDQLGPVALSELTEGAAEARVAIQARRGTAAAFGAGYSLFFLILVLGPYRRGEAWAWWSILAASLVTNGLLLLRVPTLGTNLGLGAATIPFGVTVLALALGASRLRST